jgi:hypothetical protein
MVRKVDTIHNTPGKAVWLWWWESFKKKDILFKGHFVLDLNQNQGYGYRRTSLFGLSKMRDLLGLYSLTHTFMNGLELGF